MEVLREGYQIPFLAPPPLSLQPQEFPSYLGNQEKWETLQKEVEDMLTKGAIEPVVDQLPGFYNRLFLVQKASGKWRPVLDVSRLNTFVRKTKFSMESTRSVLAAIQEGDWLTTVDMKDAYFHVPIHPTSRRFLRFVFAGQVYQFRALCFGLSTAPKVFTRVLAPLAKMVHLAGFRIILYLDDWLILAKSPQEMERALKFILDLALNLGIIINEEKSQLTPTQVGTYLGMIINTSRFWVFPTLKRIDNALSTFIEFRNSKKSPAKKWMKVLGHMSSLEQFIPGARLRMRPLQFYLKSAWNRLFLPDSSLIDLPDNLLPEIEWWIHRSRLSQGVSLSPQNPSLSFMSDASDTGWGQR